MSELANVMQRFRAAVDQIKQRIDAAEARPDRQDLEKILKQREADLAEFEALKAKLNDSET